MELRGLSEFILDDPQIDESDLELTVNEAKNRDICG